MNDVLQLTALTRHFEQGGARIDVLRGIDARLRPGEIVALLGPSGSGKSTLLRCVNLLEQPTSGRIVVTGEEVTDPDCDIDAVRRKVGMVFQSFNLFPHLTAMENCTIAQRSVLGRNAAEATKTGTRAASARPGCA